MKNGETESNAMVMAYFIVFHVTMDASKIISEIVNIYFAATTDNKMGRTGRMGETDKQTADEE